MSFSKNLFSIILIIKLFFCFSIISAQEKTGSIIFEADYSSKHKVDGIVLKGTVFKNRVSEYLYGVEDAVVLLRTTKGDTIKYGSTDSRGFCTLKNIPLGKYSVSIDYMGFLPVKLDINHTSSNTKVYVQMEEGGFLLDEIKVQGNIPLLISKGDTLIVNSKAVQTQQGAAAIEIIKQVPGIEISSSGAVMAFGEVLKRTYVGGSTLFGRDVLSALNNLDADLVKNIKFYDEEELVSIVNGVSQTRRIRVMNIETTRQLLASTTGHVFDGVGKDIKEGESDDGKVRYKAGGEFNMFTTKVILKGSVLTNNVGLTRNSIEDFTNIASKRHQNEKTLSQAGISIEYNNRQNGNIYGPGTTTRLSYNYSKGKESKNKFIDRDYFPTEKYNNRGYYNEATDVSMSSGHIVKAYYGASYKERKIRSYSLSHTMSFDNGEYCSENLQKEESDYSSIIISDRIKGSKCNWSVQDKLYVSTQKGNNVNIDFNWGNNDNTDIQEIDNNGLEKVYKSSPLGKSLIIGTNASIALFRKRFNNESNGSSFNTLLKFNITTKYNYSKSRQYRYDITENMIMDSLSSYLYSNNHWENGIGITFIGNGNKESIVSNSELSFSLIKADINDNDRFVSKQSRNGYIMPNARFSMGIRNLSFSYTLNPSVPSLEQIRTFLNDNNPLFIIVGNKDLDYVIQHSIHVTLRNKSAFSASNNLLSMYIRCNIEQNAIVPYSVYYPQGGEIAEYPGYKVLPGATFSSYRNVNSNIRSSMDLWYTTRLSAIRTKLQVNLGGEYLKRPSYVQNELNVTDTYTGKFHFNTYTSYKWMTLDIKSTTKYTESKNTIKNNYKYLNQDLKATAKITMLKTWYVNGTYIFNINKPVGGSGGYTNRNNILNVSTGVKLLRGRLTAGVSVFDIFDKSTDFSTMLYEDYVQNTWTPTFGRYISFDVLFNLRKNKYK